MPASTSSARWPLQVQPAFPPEHEIRRFKIDAGGEAAVDVGPGGPLLQGQRDGQRGGFQPAAHERQEPGQGAVRSPWGCLSRPRRRPIRT